MVGIGIGTPGGIPGMVGMGGTPEGKMVGNSVGARVRIGLPGSGAAVLAAVGVSVGVSVGVDVGVSVGVSVGVGKGVSVGNGVEVGNGVSVGAGVSVGNKVEGNSSGSSRQATTAKSNSTLSKSNLPFILLTLPHYSTNITA